MFANFNHRRLKDLLIGAIAGMVFVGFVQEVKAESIATMPNEGGGQVVLTDEPCKHEGRVYNKLNRLYTYTARGYTVEGCYAVEDDTVVAIWHTNNAEKMRYPISAFTLTKKKGVRYGT
jgi:hypothetical protein